jgi:hypothetical protein
VAAPAGAPAAAGWQTADHVLVQHYGSRRQWWMTAPRSGHREPRRADPWPRRYGPPMYRDEHGRMQVYTGKNPDKWTRVLRSQGMFPHSRVMRGGVPDLGYEHNGLWQRW